jgi:SpoVK/Ycf46/Vps4 family AAA+-type ATPase
LGLYNLDLVNSNDQELKEMVCQLGPRALFLLEDIDTVAAAWNRSAAKEGEKTEKLTLGGVLNAIDGVAESDGRVLVITTNMREKLDPALLRPGRIDLQLELGPMSPQMFRAGFENFFPDSVIPLEFEWPAGMTPAEFQQIVLRHSASPATLLDEIQNRRIPEKLEGAIAPLLQDHVIEPVADQPVQRTAQLFPVENTREPALWANGS